MKMERGTEMYTSQYKILKLLNKIISYPKDRSV